MEIKLELPDDFHDQLERQAKAEGRKIEDLIKLAVDQYTNKKQRPATDKPRPRY